MEDVARDAMKHVDVHRALKAEEQAYDVVLRPDLSVQEMTDLWRRLPGGAAYTPFQSVEFLDKFRNSMPGRVKGEFQIYEFRRAATSTPLMLLPVLVRRRGPVRIASLPDLRLADQSAPVLSRAYDLPQDHGPALWEAFLEALSGADLYDFYNIVPGVEGQPNPLYLLPSAVNVDSQYMLDLRAGEAAAPWRRKGLSKELRAKFRKLQSQGVEFAVPENHSERKSLFETMLAQKRARFEAQGLTNLLDEPFITEFYRSLAETDNGNSASLFSLRCGPEIVAGCMAFASARSINTVILSIGSERWHCCSPGVVLMSKVLDWAEANGFEYFSFGTGNQLYKQRFGGDAVATRRLSGALTRAGEAYRLVRTMKNAAARSA